MGDELKIPSVCLCRCRISKVGVKGWGRTLRGERQEFLHWVVPMGGVGVILHVNKTKF